MNKIYLIGLNGYMRSGKDTTAGFIKEWATDYSFGYSQDAFARRLKESAAAAVGIHGDEVSAEGAVEFCELLKQEGTVIHVVNEEGTGYSITGREYLQYYGTEAHRQVFHNDFWVDAVLPKGFDNTGVNPAWHENFASHGKVCEICVVTDCRFPNEAQRIKELKGYVWEIDREGHGGGTHASEQPLPRNLVDLTIHNNGSLSDLRDKVSDALESLTGLDVAIATAAEVGG